MTTHPDRRLAGFTSCHHGLFRMGDVLELGFTVDRAKRRLAHGQWEHLHRGVYHVSGAPMTWRTKLLAACWSSPDRAVASHRSALAMWSLPGARELVPEITTERWRRNLWERRVVRAIQAAGFPMPVLQHALTVNGRQYRLDAAYPDARIGLEYDSYLYHGGRAKFVRDLDRRNALTAAGWLLIHVTAADLRGGAPRFCHVLGAALTRAGTRPPEVA